MTDRQLLLAAIRENPEEDTPRLAFADVVEEQGHDQNNRYFLDWAELIRVQVEFARVERFSPRWLELARRQAELFESRKKDWPALWSSRLGEAAYRRGFRECHVFYVDSPKFESTFAFAVRANPVRALQLGSMNRSDAATLRKLVAHDALQWVETLELGNGRARLAAKFLRHVAPNMPRLRAVGLNRLGLSSSAAGELLGRATIPNLTALDLSQNSLFNGALAECRPDDLFFSPTLKKLQWLDLHQVDFTSRVCRLLGNCPGLVELRYLDLSTHGYGDHRTVDAEGAELLASGPTLRRLEVLNLSQQRIGSPGLRAIAQSPMLATIRELHLEGNDIDDDGVVALAASPHARSLARLDLSNNALGPASAEAILASPHLTGLRILTVSGMRTEDGRPAEGPLGQLAERFPDQIPRVPHLHGNDLFEPIP